MADLGVAVLSTGVWLLASLCFQIEATDALRLLTPNPGDRHPMADGFLSARLDASLCSSTDLPAWRWC